MSLGSNPGPPTKLLRADRCVDEGFVVFWDAALEDLNLQTLHRVHIALWEILPQTAKVLFSPQLRRSHQLAQAVPFYDLYNIFYAFQLRFSLAETILSNKYDTCLQWRTQEFFSEGGGSTNSTEDREDVDLGAVAPQAGVLEAAVIWYKKFHFIQ